MNFNSAAASPAKLETWTIGRGSPLIEYPEPLLRRLAAEAVQAFRSVPRGGAELGGVLFGTQSRDGIRIAAYRVIECEYLSGPTFTLSANDKSRLAGLLRDYAADSALAGLEPVGWFVSHTRSGIVLNEAELALYNEYFPQPKAIALVLKPHATDPTRAGFFFREPKGVIRSGASYREFLIDFSTPPTPAPALPPPPTGNLDRAHSRRRLASVLAGTAGLVVCAILYTIFRPPEADTPALLLQARDKQLMISWDRQSRLIKEARHGRLEIMEGRRDPYIVSLTPADLRSGVITYMRDSGNIKVRLHLMTRGSTIELSSQFLIPAETGPGIAQLAPAPVADPVSARALQTRFRSEARAVPRIFQLPAVRPAGALPEPSVPLPEEVAITSEGLNAPPSPDAFWQRPQAPLPRSGRLIWTGNLRKNAELRIGAGGPSEGRISGSWPAGPYRLRAYPARWDGPGITAFVASTNIVKPEGEFPPVRYTWDPARASAITAVEQTEGAERWRNLTVYSRARRLSAVVLDWEAR